MTLTVVKTTALTGTITNAQLAGGIDLTSKVTGTLPIGNGGTNSTATTFVNAATNVTGALPIVNGGTGGTSYSPGKVLQVQNVNLTSSNTTVSNTSFGATEVTDQITPSATSSKVLVMMSLTLGMYEGSGTGNFGQVAIYRSIAGGTYSKVGFGNADNAYTGQGGFGSGTEIDSARPCNLSFVDSPNTTSAVDYKLYIRLNVASNGGDNINTGPSNLQRSVTLMEIGA